MEAPLCLRIWRSGLGALRYITYSLHCSSFFWGLPFRILNTNLVQPKKERSMEITGTIHELQKPGLLISVGQAYLSGCCFWRMMRGSVLGDNPIVSVVVSFFGLQ